MAGQIRVTPEKLRLGASQYRTELGKMSEITVSMDSILSTLTSEWEGNSCEAFVENYESYCKVGMTQIQDEISDLAAMLDSVATKMEEADAAMSAISIKIKPILDKVK